MRHGKLTGDELSDNVLGIIKHRRDEIICGAALGEDCACFKSNELMVISTDPITGATSNLGSLAIKVATNDIYAAGGEPFLAMVTIIAPVTSNVLEIREIMIDAEKEATTHNLEIVGGHTEFSDAVNRTVLSVVVVGKAKKHIRSTEIMEGDSVLLTKSVGLEGTVILSEKHADIFSFSDEEKRLLSTYSNSISVFAEAEILRELNISSMHDVTEGGVFGAVAEVCEGSGKGALIRIWDIPVTPLTQKVCDRLRISPYKLISSGSLLLTTSEPKKVMEKLRLADILVTEIGKIEGEKALAISLEGEVIPLKVNVDELFKAVV